jgi:hypothetical protein
LIEDDPVPNSKSYLRKLASFISQRPVFWAFYSPSFLTQPSHGFRQMLLTPKSFSANKINGVLITDPAAHVSIPA